MSSAPPPFGPSFERPEVPDGITPASRNGWSPPSAPEQPMRPPEFAVWAPFAAIVTAYALAVFAALVIGGVVSAAGHKSTGTDLPSGVVLAATLIQDLLLVGLTLLFARAGGAVLTPAQFGLRRVRFVRGFAWAAAAFAAFYLFLWVWSIVVQNHEKDDLAQQLGANDNPANLVIVAFLVAIVAPIAEELFFRGFLFPSLWRRFGWVPAAVATGILFGLVHAGGTPAVFLVPLGVLGFLLCALYRQVGSLLPGMGVHALNNSLALGVTLHWAAWQVLVAIAVAPTAVVYAGARVAAWRPRANPLLGT